MMVQEKKIKILICDDDVFLCEGFRMQFELFDLIDVVGMAHDSNECLQLVKECQPDVVLLDIRMESEEAGIRAVSRIKEDFPEIKIIMLTSYDDPAYVYDTIANGADDYCLKTMEIGKLVDKIRDVVAKRTVLEKNIMDKIVSQSRKNQRSLIFICNKIMKLSPGEYELLRDLYYGETYRSIAKKNCVEMESVKKMGHRVLKKMGSKNMLELLTVMKELRIIEFMDMGKE